MEVRPGQLGAAFARSPIPQWVVNADTLQILDVNDAALSRFGHGREEFLGMRFSDLHGQDEHEAAHAHLIQEVATGAIQPQAWRLVTPTGAHWVRLAMIDVSEIVGGGRLVQAFDVSTEVRLARERDAARGQADAAIRLKDVMIATIGQEVRQQLAPILPAIGIMEQRISAEIGVKARESVKRHVQALARLVERLVDTSALQQGTATLQREIVDLRQVVQNIATQHLPDLTARNLQFDLRLPDSAIWVALDVERFHHAVSHLVVNARHRTAAGGHVWVHVSGHDQVARLVVGDNGRGIALDLLPHIFEPFTPAVAASGGLGLGLSVVRAIVELHDGRVAAASAGANRPTEFVITLPLALPPSMRPGGSAVTGKPPLEPLR